MAVVSLRESTYIKSVKEHSYGTIDIKQASGMEEFSLPQSSDFKACAAGVGKTWILKEFSRRYYENTVCFNFDDNEEYKQFFETTKEVDQILQNLILASGQKIVPEKTLIIFDV